MKSFGERSYVRILDSGRSTLTAAIVDEQPAGETSCELVDPWRVWTRDRLSAGYPIALGARVVQEVSQLLRRSRETGKRLATLSIDTEIRFRSAGERTACSRELAATVARLVARYHDETAPGGRRHRLVIVAHASPGAPKPTTEETP